tara:strand:+ start:525 stop:995 length:471 start_codon:yes stop_codon:yes gene_type:complete
MTEQELLRIIDLATSIKQQHDLMKDARLQAECAQLELQNLMKGALSSSIGFPLNTASLASTEEVEVNNPYTYGTFRYKALNFFLETSDRTAQNGTMRHFTKNEIARAIFGKATKRNLGRASGLIHTLTKDEWIINDDNGGWYLDVYSQPYNNQPSI